MLPFLRNLFLDHVAVPSVLSSEQPPPPTALFHCVLSRLECRHLGKRTRHCVVPRRQGFLAGSRLRIRRSPVWRSSGRRGCLTSHWRCWHSRRSPARIPRRCGGCDRGRWRPVCLGSLFGGTFCLRGIFVDLVLRMARRQALLYVVYNRVLAMWFSMLCGGCSFERIDAATSRCDQCVSENSSPRDA